MKLRLALFYHSLVSDWNHGNAHFLRGIASELLARGHAVEIFEPEHSWSRENLLRDHGDAAVRAFEEAFPQLRSISYRVEDFDLDAALDGVDVALVHEWSDPALVAAIGRVRRHSPDLRVFFHDTHHRAVSAPYEIDRFQIDDYDGVLAYGNSLKQAYEKLGWGKQVHVWHEAADTRVFYPRTNINKVGDVVWIGNWGDEERSQELREFFMQPVRNLELKSQVYGVRYPADAVRELQDSGIHYLGWLPNFQVPSVFAAFRLTVHVPRRPYTRQLPGIPTIRPFEALACGIPLISAPWSDTEGLFHIGRDFLMVHSGAEMQRSMRDLLNDPAMAHSLAQHGLDTIHKRHTCGHRVSELLQIYFENAPLATAAAEVHG